MQIRVTVWIYVGAGNRSTRADLTAYGRGFLAAQLGGYWKV